MQSSALTAWELFCQRGDRRLFRGLDLWLECGEAMHVVGPNGSGKTSLLRMLAGLLRPSFAPELKVGGDGVGIVHWKGTVGFVDHRPALDEHLPLALALGFWQRLDRQPSSALDRLEIAHLADVPVRYLSTGQRKRAAFARLLVQASDHWLLDEPLNGLDETGQALVERLIAEQRAAGGAVLVASHQEIELPDAALIDLREYRW